MNHKIFTVLLIPFLFSTDSMAICRIQHQVALIFFFGIRLGFFSFFSHREICQSLARKNREFCQLLQRKKSGILSFCHGKKISKKLSFGHEKNCKVHWLIAEKTHKICQSVTTGNIVKFVKRSHWKNLEFRQLMNFMIPWNLPIHDGKYCNVC